VNLTLLSLRNPLAVAAVALALCIFGAFAFVTLGIAITPNANFPSVTVTTIYPGADPSSIEANVTKPIEDAIATLPNVDTNGLTSISSYGVSTVIVQFTTAANSDLVAVDVERVVNGVRNNLPANADPPVIHKIDINAGGVATIIASGPSLVPLQDLVENSLKQQFNALPGVGAVNIRSGVTREIHVTVDQEALRARGLSINNVTNALQSEQIEVPAGSITEGTTDLSVYFDSLASRVDGLGDIVINQTPNGPVYMRDVAKFEDTYQRRTSIARVNGKEGIGLVIVKLADANNISIVDAVKRKIDQLNPVLPGGIHLDLVVDTSTYTAKSFGAVRNALVEAVFATGLILLVFLHTWRSTLTVLVSIPVSILSTLALMDFLHYNLNLLTMVALVVSVGILVDDSIVVLENISRHLEMGKSPMDAALDGRNEISLAAITITLVDVVVYVPLATMTSGLPGQFIGPFAVVITSATLASLIVSFTLTPLQARLYLRRHEASFGRSPMARFGQAWDRGFEWLEHQYGRLLSVSLPHRWIVIAIGLISFAGGLSLLIFGLIGFDFFPNGDQSEVDLTLTMPPATSLAATTSVADQIEAELHTYPEVRSIFTVIGPGGGGMESTSSANGSNSAQIAALLVRPSERTRPVADIGEDMRQHFDGRYPGAKIRIGMPNAFGLNGFGGAPTQIQVQGPDPAIVDSLATQIQQVAAAVPGAVNVDNSNDNLQTQLRAKFDWTRAADLGIAARDGGTALRAALDGFTSNSNQYRANGASSIPIRVLTTDAGNMTPTQISQLPVQGTKGVVQLGQFSTFEQARIPTTIQHVNRFRSVTISASPGEGYLTGTVQNNIQAAVAKIPLPAGYSISYAGSGQQGGTAIADMVRAVQVAVGLMYMLMMILFGSVTLPLAVLASLPLALIGALGALALAHSPFTLFSALGVVVLIGLVGKNAILLVDRTDRLRHSGLDRYTALRQAGPSRLRPIVMTTLSIMVALLPITTGLEEGSELLQSVGLVLIGGLLTSTLLTLVFVPAMYTIFDDLQNLALRLVRRGPPKRKEEFTPAPVPRGIPVLAGRDRDGAD
jgi:hydrophobic/amphiphilic exporter-1 (mainly G- bacteria), HAE1 family